uniref:Uncharacterized protein n=1 Tax=Biomphalaria glabrata TaxID=6526 RepID=A0A2C9L651_BIOGL
VGLNLPCANHYRNSLILDSWNGITEVALAVYKNNVRVRHVIFNATDSTNLNWMAKERVLTSSWTDLKTQKFNFFSILGDQDRVQRYFFINSYYIDCPYDYGWFVAIDNENGPCTWEKNAAFPALKYAVADTMQNWNGANVAYADYFAVLVRGSVLP